MRSFLFLAIILIFGNLYSQRRVEPIIDNSTNINLPDLNYKNIMGPAITTNSTNYTPTQLIQDVLINGCVQASNITYTGSSNARGYFDANGSNFLFQNGIILASGNISTASGPNNSGGDGTNLYNSGDPDLVAIINDSTYDASILEFDFIPSSDTISFRYIFASEEYNEWVCASVNDVFGFFLSGPGINGPYANNAKNIALIPNSNVPVSINSVNNGSAGSNGSTANCTSLAYSSYFFDNTTGTGQAIEYDGRTVILTAFAVVQQCQTYHIKLAIADGGDGVFDSGVFIEAGSFSSGGQVQMNNFSQVGDENSLFEGCTNFYVFSRLDTTDLSDSVEVVLSYSGTATQGVDISIFPTSFWIPAGQIYDTIYYSAPNDSIVENDETIIISLLSGCPCNMNQVTDTITIYDLDLIKGGIQNLTYSYCNTTAPDSIIITASVNIDPNATYIWSTGQTGNTIYVPPISGRTMYSVSISDPCGTTVYDSVAVIIGDFAGINIDVTQPQCHDVCNGSINVTTIGGAPPYSYYWIPNGTSVNGSATNLCSGGYKVTVTDSLGCKYFTPTPVSLSNPLTMSNSSYININTTKYCNGSGTNINLTTTTDISSIQYLWNTSETTSSIVVNPSNGNSIYWVNFQDICGNSFTDSITLKLSDMTVPSVTTTDILCNNTCTGSVNVSPNGGVTPYTYQWTPSGTGTPNSGSVNQLCAGNYSVTITDLSGCTKSTNFSIASPSAVATSISSTNALCFGSCDGYATVTTSGGVSPYTYTWNPSNTGTTNSGIVSSLCSGNYAVTVTDANNCTSTNSFIISQPTEISATALTVNATCFNLCNGTATINVSGGTAPYSYLWYNSTNSASISNLCANTSYSFTATDVKGCNKTNSFTISQPTEILITTNVLALDSANLCVGSASVSASGGSSPYSYFWSNSTSSAIANNLCANTYTITVTDANACSKIDSITIYQTSIEEKDYSQFFSIYPNPTNEGNINIELKGILPNDVNISLYDIAGKKISVAKINTQKDVIHLDNIPSGVYNLRISIKDKAFNQRVVVNK